MVVMMNMQEKYEEYQNYVNQLKADIYYQKFFQKINYIVNQKQLRSIMNDCKWIKLLDAIEHLNFPPAYIAKLITEAQDLHNEQKFMQGIPKYLGDWHTFYQEGMPIFVNIEYILVKPLFAQSQG